MTATTKGKTKEKKTERGKDVKGKGFFDNLVFKQTKTYEMPDGSDIDFTMRTLSTDEVTSVMNIGDENKGQFELMYLSLCEDQDISREDVYKNMPMFLFKPLLIDILKFNGLEEAVEAINNEDGGEEGREE